MKNLTLKSTYNKVILTLGFLIALGNTSFAQSTQEEVDMYQAIFGMEKKALTVAFIDNADDTAFWTLYDEYEVQRKLLGQKRLQILMNYANNSGVIGDEETDQLITDVKAQKKSLDKLIDQYYKKIKKASGSKSAAQFYQLENYILSAIRLEIMDNVPFFDQFE